MKSDHGSSLIEVLIALLIIMLTTSALFRALHSSLSIIANSSLSLPFLKYDLSTCTAKEIGGLKIIECKNSSNPKSKISLVK